MWRWIRNLCIYCLRVNNFLIHWSPLRVFQSPVPLLGATLVSFCVPLGSPRTTLGVLGCHAGGGLGLPRAIYKGSKFQWKLDVQFRANGAPTSTAKLLEGCRSSKHPLVIESRFLRLATDQWTSKTSFRPLEQPCDAEARTTGVERERERERNQMVGSLLLNPWAQNG